MYFFHESWYRPFKSMMQGIFFGIIFTCIDSLLCDFCQAFTLLYCFVQISIDILTVQSHIIGLQWAKC